MTEHAYEVSVEWVSDRKGIASSPVLETTIEVATPPEFDKGMPGIWSPEHLFVAAVNSCLMTTFLAIAENSKLKYSGFNSKAIGYLKQVEGKFQITDVILEPVITVSEQDRERAERVLQKSHTNCLISNSIRSAIVFKPTVNIQVHA